MIIIKRKPRRPSIPQTESDRNHAIERRRNNAALFDRMTEILTQVVGGKLTKQALMKVAQQVADQKQATIDRRAKRMKDCLICWFCEQACDLMRMAQSGHEPPEAAAGPPEFTTDELALRDDELSWVYEPESLE